MITEASVGGGALLTMNREGRGHLMRVMEGVPHGMGGVGTPPFAQEMEALNIEPSVGRHKPERGQLPPPPTGAGGRRGVCSRP